MRVGPIAHRGRGPGLFWIRFAFAFLFVSGCYCCGSADYDCVYGSTWGTSMWWNHRYR